MSKHTPTYSDLVKALDYLHKVLCLIEQHQCLPVPAILRNNIESLEHTLDCANEQKGYMDLCAAEAVSTIIYLRNVLIDINAIIGNVNHNQGHGKNAAKLRGVMLMSIKDYINEALTHTKAT